MSINTNLKCIEDNNIKCNKINNCYYINNNCYDKNSFINANNNESNYIKCIINNNPKIPNTFILECINTNYSKNILIKGIIINSDCLYNNETNETNENNNYLYNKNCNILLFDNIITNKEFKIKDFIYTFNNTNGELSIKPILTHSQLKQIKEQNNIITLIDIYDNHIRIRANINDDSKTI